MDEMSIKVKRRFTSFRGFRLRWKTVRCVSVLSIIQLHTTCVYVSRVRMQHRIWTTNMEATNMEATKVINFKIKWEIYQFRYGKEKFANLARLYGYIFRILQHFATKFWNFTNVERFFAGISGDFLSWFP